MIEEVTADELAICSKVKAVLVDKEWFQVYDNLTKFTEDYVASGMYWNYFYNVWKTVSYSPFSNAIVLVDNTAETALPATFTAKIADKSVSEAGTVLTIMVDEAASLSNSNVRFIQGRGATTAGVAVHPYGAVIFPAGVSTGVELIAEIDGVQFNMGGTKIAPTLEVGNALTFTKVG